MAFRPTRTPASLALQGVCVAALTAGLVTVPELTTLGATPAAAAECTYSVPTYVFEPATSTNIASKRVLHKYMDWGPRGADATFLDTQYTASLPMTSKVFTGGGNGVIYEATVTGQVKVYKDNTATGGSLLTLVKTHSALDLHTAKRIWTNGSRIFVLLDDNTLEVYKQSAPTTGDGTLTKIAVVGGTSVAALFNAKDVWMVNSTVYELSSDGAINSHGYSETEGTGGVTARVRSISTLATGVTGAAQAWSPGSGAVNTQSTTSDPDTTGQLRKYTTGPWTEVDDYIRGGIVGEIMADAGPCLADPDPNTAPYYVTPPDETGGEPATEPADEPAAAPSKTVTGTFTLGNGQPAPGLPVTITAPDVNDEADGDVKETIVGQTTTQSDGTWSLTLPATLPADVQKVKDDNGGVLNLQAYATGTTSTSKVKMLGVDALTAVTDAPAAPGETEPAPDNGHSTKLIPNTLTDTPAAEQDTYSAAAEKDTYAGKVAADPMAVSDDAPDWQSDYRTLPTDYNPYLVDGKDISSEPVTAPITPMASGSCDTIRFKDASKIKYTVVGEAHAGWDSKSTFEYESSMSTTFDIAVKSNGNWNIGGSKELAHSISVSVGYYNQKQSRQYKIPVEYIRYKHQHVCSGTVRSTWYTIEPNKYKIGSEGAAGKEGRDVSGKDGPRNFEKSPKSHRAYLLPGNGLQLAKGKSVKFGNAVTFFNLALGAKTGYDTNHRQRILAGSKSGKHWIWGKNGSISSGKAGVFYAK